MLTGSSFRKHPWIIILLFSFFISIFFLVPVEAVDIDEINSEIDAKQEELESVEKRKMQEERYLEQRLNREAVLEEELEMIEQQIQELQEERDLLRKEIIAVKDEIARVEEELAEAEERLGNQEDLLNQRLRTIQQYGVVSYFEVLFESSNFHDFLTRLYNLSIIASHDLRLMEEIMAERDLIEARKDELAEKRSELEAMHLQVESNEEKMKRAAARREEVLEELQEAITKNLQAIADLEEEAQQLDTMIQELIAEAESRFSGLEGELLWPIEPPNWISSGYGWRRDPFSGLEAWHGGIDIAPQGGAANYILAAARGEVIFSGWNGGYGNCLMIDHGEGTVTLYSHMSTLLAATGDIVERGERIGRAGTTGYSTGVHLHFEVREYGKEAARSYPSGKPDYRRNPMDYF